jgi:uncharacterized protein (DUF697 family)
VPGFGGGGFGFTSDSGMRGFAAMGSAGGLGNPAASWSSPGALGESAEDYLDDEERERV